MTDAILEDVNVKPFLAWYENRWHNKFVCDNEVKESFITHLTQIEELDIKVIVVLWENWESAFNFGKEYGKNLVLNLKRGA